MIQLIVVLLVIGVLVWALDQFPALDPTIKQVVRAALITMAVIYAILTLLPWAAGVLDRVGLL